VIAITLGLVSPFAHIVIEAKANKIEALDGRIDFQLIQPTRDELRELGVTDEEIDTYLRLEASGIFLHDGVVYNRTGSVMEDKAETSVFNFWYYFPKLMEKYNNLPDWVKMILTWKTFLWMLSKLEHWTGALDSGLYNACMYVIGWSYGANNTCWLVTKILLSGL